MITNYYQILCPSLPTSFSDVGLMYHIDAKVDSVSAFASLTYDKLTVDTRLLNSTKKSIKKLSNFSKPPFVSQT